MERLGKIVRYIELAPMRINEYGLKTFTYKLIMDLALLLDMEKHVPNQIRWQAAHQFHWTWKLSQKSVYGSKEYNHRIDTKSLEVLNDFYETGTDFTGKTVLDVGCGTRGVLPVITAKHKLGADPTIEKVKKFFDFYPDAIYVSEKAEELGFEDNSIDVIVCNNALNHFENDDLALAQMHRVLKKGGLLLIEVFIEPMNIAHTYSYNECNLTHLLTKYFKPVKIKYERLKVKVEIDEKLDGKLPMRWGGIFKKC